MAGLRCTRPHPTAATARPRNFRTSSHTLSVRNAPLPSSPKPNQARQRDRHARAGQRDSTAPHGARRLEAKYDRDSPGGTTCQGPAVGREHGRGLPVNRRVPTGVISLGNNQELPAGADVAISRKPGRSVVRVAVPACPRSKSTTRLTRAVVATSMVWIAATTERWVSNA